MRRALHWTDAVLAAALDPSGGGEIGASARAHAIVCPACAAALAEAQAAERVVASALSLLDHPVPSVDMAQIIASAAVDSASRTAARLAARTANAAPGMANERTTSRPRVPRSVLVPRRARWGVGAMILGAATVAAAAVPGSPIRHLVTRLFVSSVPVHTPALSSRATRSSSASTSSVPQTLRGVAIIPNGSIAILFRSSQPTGVIRLLPESGPRVAVRGNGDGATYTVSKDTIIVENSSMSALSYDIELPSVAQCPTVHIRVGNQLVYSRRGDRILTRATPDAAGRYSIPVGPPQKRIQP